MALDILRLKFEAEQKRSRQIEKKLNDIAPERIPDTKQSVMPVQTEKQEPAPKQDAALPEVKPAKTASQARTTMRSGNMSLKDAIVMSEIISKPVSKRR